MQKDWIALGEKFSDLFSLSFLSRIQNFSVLLWKSTFFTEQTVMNLLYFMFVYFYYNIVTKDIVVNRTHWNLKV